MRPGNIDRTGCVQVPENVRQITHIEVFPTITTNEVLLLLCRKVFNALHELKVQGLYLLPVGRMADKNEF